MIEDTSRPGARTWAEDANASARRWSLFGGFALLAAGFALNRMWTVLPWERLGLSLVLSLMAAALAWPLRRFAGWSWASGLALVWVLALVGFLGPMQVLGTFGLAVAAAALGGIWRVAGVPVPLAVATALGLGLIAGLGGWILTWPVHFAWSWWPVVAGLLLWRRHQLRESLMDATRGWRAAVAGSPRWAALAVGLLGLASTACWLPTMQVDDLAYHLGLPTQLLMYGEYRPDPVHQVWSYAPWAGDALQGFAAVLAGEHARGGLNALWLAVAAGGVWSASAGIGARPTERWAALALFASLPPLVWMAGGMQTELAATALLAALVAVIVLPPSEGATGGRLIPGAILFGALVALKGVHVLSALPLLAYGGWRHRHGIPWRRLPLAVFIVLVVGGSSYWQAWWQTGNPVLPLFNGLFQSPYFPTEENYRDARWFAGFGPLLPWQMVFDTDRYVEAWDGGIGFSLIALSGAWLVALLHRETRVLALAMSLALLLPLLPMQYVRYAYPGLLLLVLAQVPFGEARFGARAFRWVLLAACAINLAFQANAGWLHHSAALKRVIRSGGDEASVYTYYVPERMLLQQIPADDGGLVLATNPARGYVAELGGRGRGVFDHDPQLKAAHAWAEADPSGARWSDLFGRHGIRWVLTTPASASVAENAGLRRSGHRVATLGDAELWQITSVGSAQ